MTWVLATRNRGKLAEISQILADAGMPEQVLDLDDIDVPDTRETGVTFAENALLKARAVVAQSGMPAMADDSGLAVDVLGGAPGVFSARWCGRHGDDAGNLDLLLKQLSDVAMEHRAARFVCAAVAVWPDGREVVELGELTGRLTFEPRGSNGFGYDPIFEISTDQGPRTTAELTPGEKHAISHRGRAFRALIGKHLVAGGPPAV
ncbi:MAG: RdgB/HAM1 family non-canonical purine NTP pyrophosphatase [Actinobacteria bacterium]|jgi:XTP/dITP diphosphohydrolase|nr:RdgB/HAM1 family non-canonical purine NTP pyrophosphatase [Actinomycetota bacterium]MCO5300719.1 RdgB/HAM1 family non-canonical purine NTP pyrophosphatase [Candidatus Nanopelagicales bacterium]MCB9427264.1 RdgB/HAM1 family non-canonical purine NTP pyrophosphatase [Actinomycetota bacterium]HPE11165.1 RdgB/HAM1 family non-canonical purine NTP pyrophosphatase [Actinomycetota bacterium]HPQ84476.1 RdgB/HAM1 family non-canonical purine NTP pyrophosphatase [Actinomycetota bacterium]